MCVRLGYYCDHTLAEVQARDFRLQGSEWRRYLAWFIAEFSVMITDLPEVIGFGIACNLFFGWPYWIGVIVSFVTTLLFLTLQRFGIQYLEIIIVVLVGIMSIALFVEMGLLHPPVTEILSGWYVLVFLQILFGSFVHLCFLFDYSYLTLYLYSRKGLRLYLYRCFRYLHDCWYHGCGCHASQSLPAFGDHPRTQSRQRTSDGTQNGRQVL